MSTKLFLVNWSDINETENQDYLDYEALVSSDDEFLCLSSLESGCACDFDLGIMADYDREVSHYA